ncbi:MAG: pyridoxamine 5'-phosphate oxidase family protein [Chloroflexi bacterium]|nr:pyridoxamine 5'-phosphate oxidase family protein [Chloroflexota bacterium]
MTGSLTAAATAYDTGDRSARCRPHAEQALRTDAVVWLSSVRPDGRPHLVPVWFHWDGKRIVAFSKPNARKVGNLRDQPFVMLAVGTPGPDFEVELIEATAELPSTPASAVMPTGFGAKYRELLRRAGLTVQRYAEVYSQPIVLRPTRFLGYGGHGWDAGTLAS